MDRNKAFVRHEILNLITLVNFMVSDAEMNSKKKEEILTQLKMIALLTSNEEVILGKERKFFNQPFELSEILEMLNFLLGRELKKKKLSLVPLPVSISIWADKNVVMNGLEAILRKLIFTGTQKIQLKYDIKKRSMKITYDASLKIELSKKALIDYIKETSDYTNVVFQLALTLMKANGLIIRFKKGEVEILFPPRPDKA